MAANFGMTGAQVSSSQRRGSGPAELTTIVWAPAPAMASASRTMVSVSASSGTVNSAVTSICAGSRPTSSQWRRSTSTLWATVGRVADEVAGIGVHRDEAERLAFATAADQDPRPRRADRARRAQGLGQLVVRALVGPVVVAPHLEADLQRLFQPFVALRAAAETARRARGARARTTLRRARARRVLRRARREWSRSWPGARGGDR